MKDSFFDEDQNLHIKIQWHTSKITNKLKEAEVKLKELISVRTTDKADEQSKFFQLCKKVVVRKNMQCILATRLKSLTQDLRKMEKAHFAKIQELHGVSRQSDELLRQDLIEEDEALTKSAEVTQLANSITELAVLFKDLSVLVVEQGTVLDRIDYNITTAVHSVKQGNKHLDQTLKVERSMRSTKVIVGLGVAIFVCCVILLMRWTH